ncbi:MAG: SAM-dependent methyltransferase [Thalassobium sp.]|nr:MAG: SAM-dependent methyltransferase [Thalassobium sp.]
MAFNIKTFGPVLQIVFSVMAIAGVLRIYMIVTAGEFPTTTLVGAVVEIATQLFIPWHRYVLKQELPEQKAGGVLMLHGDTPKQIEYGTDGPPVSAFLYTRDMLADRFADWDILRLEDYGADLHEGPGHSGKSALIDLIARRPQL